MEQENLREIRSSMEEQLLTEAARLKKVISVSGKPNPISEENSKSRRRRDFWMGSRLG